MAGKRNSIFSRMRLFVSKPYLEWGDTEIPLDDEELKRLRHKAELVRRISTEVEGKRTELGSLRKKIDRKQASQPAQDSRAAAGSKPSAPGNNGRNGRYGINSRADRNESLSAGGRLVQPVAGAPVGGSKLRSVGSAYQKKAAERRQYMNTQARLPGDSQHEPVLVESASESRAMQGFMDTDAVPGASNRAQVEATGAFYVEQDSREVTVQSLASGVSAVADAALCVASQDFVKAEAILRDALQSPRENVELLSLAWLDLLNILNRKTQYETEAGALQQRFGTRAPSYRTATGMAYGTPRFTAKRVMGAPEAAQLGRTILSAQDAKETMVLSFVRLDSIDAAAMPGLAIALKRLNSYRKPFVLTGGVRLLDSLESHFERHRMTLSHHSYDARMEALRLMNTPAPYNKLLPEYVAKFTQSAPAWQPPTAVFKTYADKPLELQQPMQMTPLDGTEPSSSFGSSMQRQGPASVRPTPSTGRISLLLDDCISAENADDIITSLESQAHDQRVVTVECGGLLRVDFQAAVALINWLENCAERKIVVTLRDIGVLTEALLQTLGAEQFAKIERRVADVDAAGKITTGTPQAPANLATQPH